MTKHRKTWKKEEKLAAVEYAKKVGFVEASKEYGVSATSIYKWRDKLETIGSNGLDKTDVSALHREIAMLRNENRQLKTVVADQALTIHIKEDLLKKSH